MTFRLLTGSLLQATRLPDYTAAFISRRRSAVIDAFPSSMFRRKVVQSLSGLLLYRSPVVVVCFLLYFFF